LNVTLSNTVLSVSINPKGAELVSLKDDNGKEYMWEANPEYWGKHSPVLFPIVGVLKDNSYTHNDKKYNLSRHGFARDMMFEIKEQFEDSVIFLLTADDSTKEKYPFDFELEVQYTLEDNNLYIDYTVVNMGDGDMPFSLGAHPAFALPNDFNDYSLEFEKDEELITHPLENELLTDRKIIYSVPEGILPLEYSLFKKDALVCKEIDSTYITIAENDEPFLRVTFPDFPHLGIWTKPDFPFLCIEPWQGYADSPSANGNLFEKEGMLVLEEGSEITKTLTIEILK